MGHFIALQRSPLCRFWLQYTAGCCNKIQLMSTIFFSQHLVSPLHCSGSRRYYHARSRSEVLYDLQHYNPPSLPSRTVSRWGILLQGTFTFPGASANQPGRSPSSNHLCLSRPSNLCISQITRSPSPARSSGSLHLPSHWVHCISQYVGFLAPNSSIDSLYSPTCRVQILSQHSINKTNTYISG